MVAFHWVTVEIRVLDEKVATRRDQRRVGVQFRQGVLFGVTRVADDENARRASGSLSHLAQDPV